MTTALAKAGCSWANLRAVTPAQHAQELAGPALIAAGWSPLAPGVDLLLIEEALNNLGPLPRAYFSIGSGQTASALAPAVARTVQTLRLAGVPAQQLRVGGIDADKASSLAVVYEAYQSRLEKTQRYDEAHLYQCALESLEQADPGSDCVFAIADATPLPELAHRYVQAISGGNVTRIGHSAYGVEPAPHSAAARWQKVGMPSVLSPTARDGSPGSRQYFQGDLFAPVDAATPIEVTSNPVGSVEPEVIGTVHPACGLLLAGSAPAAPGGRSTQQTQVREARGCEAEVRGIVREALRRQLPLDSIEIAYTHSTPYRSLLVDLVQRFDIAAQFAQGIPASLTRPGQALAAFYRWILSDFAPVELIHALRAGQLAVDSGETKRASSIASTLARLRIAGGRASYTPAFERLRADGANTTDDHMECAAATVESLLNLVPSELAIGLRQATEMSLDFMRMFAPAHGDLDQRAHESLVNHLLVISTSADMERPLPALLNWLQDRVAEHDCDAAAARPGALYIAPLSRAGYSARPHLFVVGMDESSFPGGVFDDPLLLDTEREAVSPALPLQRHEPLSQSWQLARVISMCPGTVTLISNRASLSDGREPYPCALFQHLQRQLGVTRPERWSLVPLRTAPSLDETEHALARYRDPGYEKRIGEQFPWLRAGARAIRARSHKGLTRFDGWLGPTTRQELAIDIGDGAVMSSAKLETLAKCPRQYFWRYILGARPPEEVEEDPGRWLQPLEMGQLLHDLYRDFMSRLALAGERVDGENSTHEELLHSLLHQKIAAFKERVPCRYRAAYLADVNRLERSARVFLNAEGDHERQFPTTTPTAFEAQFGLGTQGGLDHPDPVAIELSARVKFLLRGRVDRIDLVKAGATKEEYEIWDYKTGSPYQFEGNDLLHGGETLQWVLYAYALEKYTGKKVRRSGYFFSGDRGWGRRFDAVPPERSLLASLLEPLFEMVAQGAFLCVQRDNDHCRFCDYRRLCSSERKTKSDLSEMREETSQLRAIAGERERLRHGEGGGTASLSADTVQAYLDEAGVEGIDDVLAPSAEASLLNWMSGLQPELDWR